MVDASRIETLAQAREMIDALDAELIARLADRAKIVSRVAQIKQRDGLAARLPDRVEAVKSHVKQMAVETGLDPALAERLWHEMIEYFIAEEEKVLGKGDQA
ncbi:chorismate mutase [Thioclava atlantica]|uniref:chorismate mutase n=1 Tax=Thioclava atlantica TaxID=1317124 RepID=A0A085TY46_9RHOB|nr:chorismate mutase [Thioclava atlantica]KFE35643.1 chorismate mutase [Thioclava atlantica]